MTTTCNHVCCKCGSLKPGEPFEPGMPTSHGICPECVEELYADDFDPAELAEVKAMVRSAWGTTKP